MRGREVWFDVVEETGGPVGAGRDIMCGVVMEGEVTQYDCIWLFCVAVDGWDEEADVLGEGVGISVLGGPVFSDELVNLVVEKLRAELVFCGSRDAGDSIVRCIYRWVFSFVLLEGEGGFFELDWKGLEKNVWRIWCVAKESKGNILKNDARNLIRIEGNVGGMGESGGKPAFGLVWGEF
jgi:hypothetical protein